MGRLRVNCVPIHYDILSDSIGYGLLCNTCVQFLLNVEYDNRLLLLPISKQPPSTEDTSENSAVGFANKNTDVTWKV